LKIEKSKILVLQMQSELANLNLMKIGPKKCNFVLTG